MAGSISPIDSTSISCWPAKLLKASVIEIFAVEVSFSMNGSTIYLTALCKENKLTYMPALEYLDKKYHLNLFEEYEHIY